MTKNLLKQIMIKQDEPIHNGDIDYTQGLVEAIQQGYVADIKPKFTKKYSFSPSGLAWGSGECARFWYLAFDGQVFYDDASPFGVANRNSGTLSHDRIQDAMISADILDKTMEFETTERKYGKQKHPALEFTVKTDDPPIFGYGDAMLDFNGQSIVGEIKTMPNDGFEYKKANRKPKGGHLMQLLMYMKILKKDKGVLIYENKNNHELLTLPVQVNDEYRKWIDYAFDWMRQVRKAWTDREIPVKTYRSNSKICKGCPIQKACAEAEVGVLKIKPLEGLSETL
jgi:CRISPR/Cas system-associated exonuclease Cas4 (RecB family)